MYNAVKKEDRLKADGTEGGVRLLDEVQGKLLIESFILVLIIFTLFYYLIFIIS